MGTRKLYLTIEAEVILTVEDDVSQDDYELDMFSDNESIDVNAFTITKTEITDSK